MPAYVSGVDMSKPTTGMCNDSVTKNSQQTRRLLLQITDYSVSQRHSCTDVVALKQTVMETLYDCKLQQQHEMPLNTSINGLLSITARAVEVRFKKPRFF